MEWIEDGFLIGIGLVILLGGLGLLHLVLNGIGHILGILWEQLEELWGG